MTDNRKYQAFAAYQSTMQQFLHLQESFMSRFLADRRQDGRDTASNPFVSDHSLRKPESKSLPRCRVISFNKPLDSLASIRPDGLFLITADSVGVAPLVAKDLELRGAQAMVLPVQQLLSDLSVDQIDLSGHRSLQGIVHLAPLVVQHASISIDEWRSFSQIHVKGWFRLLQRFVKELDQVSQPIVFAASLLGGNFGRADLVPGLATGGGNLGLLKSMAVEFPHIQVKGVDFDRLPPGEIAQQIIQELLTEDKEIEVGYPEGQRTVFTSVISPLARSQPSTKLPGPESVLLVTGGCRGITAEVLKSLVVSGMTLVLVGRSALPPEEPSTTSTIEDPALLRLRLIAIAKSEGRQPTPTEIEKDLQTLLNTRQSRSNYNWFSKHCQVEYHSLDVRDSDAMGQLIQGIYRRHGRLDGVIHGAGVIEDKLIIEKKQVSFNRVFDTKVDSCFWISRCLRSDSLQFFVIFASVAGRFGNRGQADYAAANEVITRLAWQLNQAWPNTRVVAIQWGPWDTIGMASASVKKKFRDQGVIPIPVEIGSRYILDELMYGASEDAEVIIGEGPWCTDPELSATAKSSATNDLPVVLKNIYQHSDSPPDSRISTDLHHIFSLANDPYLAHHRLDGRPVLPAAAAAAWLAEMAQICWSDYVVFEIVDLQMLAGLVLKDDLDSLPMLFRLSKNDDTDALTLDVCVSMLDYTSGRCHYRSNIKLSSDGLQNADIEPWPALAGGMFLHSEEVYDRYLFHGPSFKLISSVLRIDTVGIDVNCRVSSDNSLLKCSDKVWLFDPGLLDLGPQLATVWSREIHQTTALPTRFGRIVRYNHRHTDNLSIQFRTRSHSPHRLTYDVKFINSDNQVVMFLENIESNCTAALNRLGDQSSQ
jgi:NAD(P)-dependent dehydrogenase (short-subunit alcohol dehydrogenase family)